MCGGQSPVSARPLLAALEDGHTSGGIEVDISCLRQACHRHVEADCEDGFDDLLFAEMRAHGGKHRLGDTYVLDDFPTERQQRLFGGIERGVLVFSLLDAVDLLLRDADAECDRNMLPPLIGTVLPLRDLKNQQLAIDVAQLLAMQDRIGEPHRRNEIGLGMRHHPEDVQDDRHPVKGRAHVAAGCRRVDQGKSCHPLVPYAFASFCRCALPRTDPNLLLPRDTRIAQRPPTSRIGSEPSQPAATLRMCSKKLPLLPLMSDISTTVPGWACVSK